MAPKQDRMPLPVIPENISHELREFRQWVLWRWQTSDDGRAVKPPFQSNGRRANVTNPSTWCDFREALTAHNSGNFAGIGFVLTESDPYCGIDLDACRNPTTRTVARWAGEIIERLHSYTEISPSGRGIRIIARGELPPVGRKHGSFEIYDSSRYLTITGQCLPGYTHISKRQNEVSHLHSSFFKFDERRRPNLRHSRFDISDDQELLNRASSARNGQHFDRLWSGDYSAYRSQSEADLALCSFLAFWTGGDRDRVDTLFRQSGMFRKKWDSRRDASGKTYGELTIQKALNRKQ